MNCQDFERIWNELFDATSPLPGDEHEHARAALERESALIDHAARCPACRRSSAGFQVLQRAIRAWGKAPDPPVGMADRILAAAQAPLETSRPAGRKSRLAVSSRWLIAAAASILALFTFGVISRMTVGPARDRGRLAEIPPARSPNAGHELSESPRLNEALASATEATWDLARSASEPAARLSRQFLDAATEPDTERAPGNSAAVLVPSLDSFAPDSAAAVETIQQVGDRLASGVRPLSSTARHAFGFLLGPAPPKPEVRANPPAARGA
jgi:hypothetical protein